MSTETISETAADTEYPIHNIIKQRWSPRSFSDEPVDPELLRQLFDAARWAPSSYNEQPWRFIVATSEYPKEHRKMADLLTPANQRWASNAPVLMLTVTKTTFSRNGTANRAAEHDLGQAVATLTFEATRKDLFVHQMAGIDLAKAKESYNIPSGFEPFSGIAVGYVENPEQPTNRSRKDLDEIAFRGDWNNRKQLAQ